MKKQNIITASILLMATVMFAGINAQTPHRGGQSNGPRGHEFNQRQERMSNHLSLDLSEEQQEKLKAMKTAQYKTMKPLKNKMVELKAKENTLLSEENVDLKDVNKVIDEQTSLTNKMRKIQVAHQVEVKSVLSDEQVMKLEQRKKVVKHRRAQFHRKATQKSHRQRNLG